MGYFLASPLRRIRHDPGKLLGPYVKEGMRILEPGPGMGFFTLEMARLVGARGRIYAVDIQPRMLARLEARARHAGLAERIATRRAESDTMGVEDLAGSIDLVWAFAVVHELPNARAFFGASFAALKRGGALLFSEPAAHVSNDNFTASLDIAREAGFAVADRPEIPSSRSALLTRG